MIFEGLDGPFGGRILLMHEGPDKLEVYAFVMYGAFEGL
jgi:hypothetical protein